MTGLVETRGLFLRVPLKKPASIRVSPAPGTVNGFTLCSLSKRVGNALYLNIRILVRIPAQNSRRIIARVAWLFFFERQLYQPCCRRHTVEIPWRYQEIILLSPRHLEHILCAWALQEMTYPHHRVFRISRCRFYR